VNGVLKERTFMEGTIMDEDSRTVKVFQAVRAVTHRFVRVLGICVLAAVASLGLADRANATYLHSDFAPAEDYLDREQYNWLGGLGYMFGRPYNQRRYDWSFYQFVGQCPIPEPSTIGYLGLGALGILALRNKRRAGGAT
jgi:hypothetical protein